MMLSQNVKKSITLPETKNNNHIFTQLIKLCCNKECQYYIDDDYVGFFLCKMCQRLEKINEILK